MRHALDQACFGCTRSILHAVARVIPPLGVHAVDLKRCVPLVAEEVYPVGVIKRTNINLDVELVAAAAEQLGTRGNTDTVHAAMREVVARARRRALAERDFTDLTPEALAELRAPRAG